MTQIYAASNQWASRPSDERFLTLPELQASVEHRRSVSREIETLPLHRLTMTANNEGLFASMPSGLPMKLTNWSFGQLSRMAGAPAEYMRRLPPSLAATNLNHGLKRADLEDNEAKVLFSNGDGYTARAFNGTGYGRIWDAEVISALMNTIDLDRWGVPLEAYNGVNSIEATTLYASDRDIFVFLTDQTRPIEVDGNIYFRGFYTWNSEVGSATFGISTFLFSRVCANRIIWGARDVEELRIRHTSLAPSRFLEEARPILTAMSEASDKPVIAAIRKAKEAIVAPTADAAEKWLIQQGFGKKESHDAVVLAGRGGSTGSDGDPTSLWSIVNGGTALARNIQNADRRTSDERRWSNLLRGIDFGSLPEPELAALASAN